MAFIPVTDVWQVVLSYAGTLQFVGSNRWFVRDLTGVELVARAEELAGIIETWDAGDPEALRSSNIALRDIHVRAMDTEAGIVYDEAVNNFGTNASPMLPANVCLCLKMSTGFAGRSFRGRTYVLGLSESQVTGNTMVAGMAQNYVDAYNLLLPALTASDFQLGVVSFVSEGVPRASGLFTVVTQFVAADDTVDTQRRRLHPNI